jgi:hypothetical protein
MSEQNQSEQPHASGPAVASGELLACPFCGSPGIGITLSGKSAAGCSNKECDICPVTNNYPTRQEAVGVWNKRARP